MNEYRLPLLPLSQNLETVNILRKAAQAHRYLAELKGISKTIPNEGILINTLSLQEAKESSSIENIITTHDELFKEGLFPGYVANASAKEVRNYSVALRKGFELIRKSGILTNNSILMIHEELVGNDAGFRKQAGTELKNDLTGATIYVPPQNPDDIIRLMTNLEKYINDEDSTGPDPLIKMAVIHHQFESIHPFYDGNGRCGRIINILYLVMKGLLDIPVLYLSRYIIKNKGEYYRLLQAVRENEAWENWVLFMLDGVEKTSRQTIRIIQQIQNIMMTYKHRIRDNFKFYNQDLINHIFSHPYTKIEYFQKSLKVSRLTATKYLDDLVRAGFMKKEKMGRFNYYVNTALFELLTNVPEL